MKKLIVLFYLLLTGVAVFGQFDSTSFINAIQTGGNIASVIRPTWIQGIDNESIVGIVTAVASLIIGLFAKRRGKKKLKESLEDEIYSLDDDKTTIEKIKGVVKNKF